MIESPYLIAVEIAKGSQYNKNKAMLLYSGGTETVTGNYELGEELKLNCRPDDEGINFSHIKGNYDIEENTMEIRVE